ncbi:MAG: DUF99 family protein [Nitrosopumilus sp.]|uniref:endonuclease dU n=1 Tax=Nitrosopumilus sp. TaxID=2024843 RepID=UPI00247D1C69|nr:DUF99 family protein [Nitrosopumilus sp.]MCV0391895.1 DUF99 family protein [Nitrosopumilus sp.]
MRSLHLEKKGLRGLVIAESFKENSKKSIFSGVVMRRDFLIDGFVFGSSTLEGDDATDVILKMFYDLKRSDISYVLISGLIVSMYNVINIKKLADTLQLPIIGISFNDSHGLEDAIKHHFPNSYESKIIAYRNLGKREKILLDNSHLLYVRKEGCTLNEVKHLLNNLTLYGSIPEPIRVSKLLAKTLLQKGLSF